MNSNFVLSATLLLLCTPCSVLLSMNKDRLEVAITVNSVGGTAQYYTPLPDKNNAPLSACGKVIAGIYTTGCGVATTLSMAAADYAVMNFTNDQGFDATISLALGICTGMATALGGLIVWYGGYRYLRPCLPRTNILYSNTIIQTN